MDFFEHTNPDGELFLIEATQTPLCAVYESSKAGVGDVLILDGTGRLMREVDLPTFKSTLTGLSDLGVNPVKHPGADIYAGFDMGKVISAKSGRADYTTNIVTPDGTIEVKETIEEVKALMEATEPPP